jgi:predicted RNA methylase
LGGGTGVLSFLAAQRGAHVRCVERNPELVHAARTTLSLNDAASQVEVIQADAEHYLPPEPVDVVICEMLHTGLLREKQLPVIDGFKRRYLDRFGGPLPVFVPEACIQAIEPVAQDFEFQGYVAPVPVFQEPTIEQTRTTALSEPVVFQRFSYADDFSPVCSWNDEVAIERTGHLNAVRMITKHVLAIVLDEQRTIDWYTQHIVLPLPEPIQVCAGDQVAVRFAYHAGAPLNDLVNSLNVRSCSADTAIAAKLPIAA